MAWRGEPSYTRAVGAASSSKDQAMEAHTRSSHLQHTPCPQVHWSPPSGGSQDHFQTGRLFPRRWRSRCKASWGPH